MGHSCHCHDALCKMLSRLHDPMLRLVRSGRPGSGFGPRAQPGAARLTLNSALRGSTPDRQVACCAGRAVHNIAEALEDPQLHYRKMLATTANGGREFTVVGNPVKISGFRDSNWRPPVAELNQHGAKL